MIDKRLSQLLGFDAQGIFIKTVDTRFFGKEIQLGCLFEPYGESVAFQIVLQECREIEWVIFVESFDPPGSESLYGADVIGLDIGDDGYKRKFAATTDLFEISVLYQKLSIQKAK